MAGDLVFTVGKGAAQRAQPISLADAGLRERADLQEWVRANPEILGPEIRIVTFEFSGWQSRAGAASDRLDLLGLDADGRLVVAELKRGAAPDTIEMQAIKYAAFASRFTPELLAESHAAYLTKVKGAVVTSGEAQGLLEEHAGGVLDADLLRRPRIVLLAVRFGPQVTASAVWLTEMGVDIQLVEFNAHRAEHDLILTVTPVWPVADVEEFTVTPRRAGLRAAEERSQRQREANAVTTLIAERALPDGERLELKVAALPLSVREAVTEWLAVDRRRGHAAWRNDPHAPLVWEIDGTAWSPTGLGKHIIGEASGEQRAVLAGPRVWTTADGSSLSRLAGFVGSSGRDWSDLHRVLALVRPGEWATYGDLAEVIGSAARAVGQHVTQCTECPAAYRVLTADGEVAAEFRWSDPADGRDPREVLEVEGVKFLDRAADQEQRVGAEALAARIPDQPARKTTNQPTEP